jgi:energy-converting hydrogenase Eha subunit C
MIILPTLVITCHYLSIATAQRICEPISAAVGVHVKVTEYSVLVFWVRLLLITIGNDRVAISWIVTP